jgi:hypothetical protein
MTRRATGDASEVPPLMAGARGSMQVGAPVRHIGAQGVAIEAVRPFFHSLKRLIILCALLQIVTERARYVAVRSPDSEVDAFNRAENASALGAAGPCSPWRTPR